MKVPIVNLEVWRSLYDNALGFFQLRPWETLYDSDIFGIRDPRSGQSGYGCVLGAQGQIFALCVYRGSEGLDFLRRLHQREMDSEEDDFLGVQNCLLGELEDRPALKKQDLAVIKSLGLNIRGSKAYPLFRSYLPGYGPWFLTEEEAAFLALAFAAAVQFHSRVRSEPDILGRGDLSRFLVYTPLSEEGSSASWATDWFQSEPTVPVRRAIPPFPESSLHQLLAEKLTPGGALEVGSFILPNAQITDRDRPYFARVLAVLQASTGIVLGSSTLASFDDVNLGLRELVLSTLHRLKFCPSEIRVAEGEIAEALEPIGAALGIQIHVRKKLSALSELRHSMARARF